MCASGEGALSCAAGRKRKALWTRTAIRSLRSTDFDEALACRSAGVEFLRRVTQRCVLGVEERVACLLAQTERQTRGRTNNSLSVVGHRIVISS
jgi:hypothetical protein